jgi:hypothetical protein
MVRHDIHRHLRGPRWGLAGHTRDVVRTLPFTIHALVLKRAFEGCRVSGRVGVREVSCGIRLNVVLGWRVSAPCLYHRPIH